MDDMDKVKSEVENTEAPKKPTKEWTTSEAGHVGGQMVKRLVEEGEESEKEDEEESEA